MTRIQHCLICCVAFGLCATGAVAEEEVHAHEHEHGQEAHPETERIVVTATPLEHSSDELAAPVTTLQRDDVVESLGTTLGETLSRTPGIATSGFARGASRPIIRGQDAFRTEVLEDGLPTQDVSRLSPDHGVPVNPLSARSIEVVRGPATLRYGGGAAGGVVNTLTGRVPTSLVENTESEILSSFDTNGNDGLVAARIDGSAGDIALHFDGLYRDADDYNAGGSQQGARSNRQQGTQTQAGAAALGASWIGERGRVGVAYAHFRNEYGIPEAGEDIEVDMVAHRLRAEADLDDPLPGFHALRMRAAYTDYEHDERDAGVVGQTFDNREFEVRLEGLHDDIAGFRGAIGLDVRYRNFKAGGEAAEFLAPTRTQSTAVYLFEERALNDWLHTEIGGRVERTSVRGEPAPAGATSRQTSNFTPLSGSLGFVAHATDELTLGVVGAVSQRAPAHSELFARGAHEATATFEIGDPALDEETSYTGELRLGYLGSRARLDVSAFLTRYDDYIFGRRTGFFDLASGLEILRYEARDALFYGGEIAGEVDLFDCADYQFALQGQFDWVHARFERASGVLDRDVPRITPIRWGGALVVRNDRTRGRIGFLRTENQTRVADRSAEGETNTSAFTMLDLNLLHTVYAGEHAEVDLVLRATNLLDESARNHVAFNKDELRLPGRSFRIGVQGRF